MGIREYFRESKVIRWTQEELSMSQEWSRVVSAEVKEGYVTLKVSKHTAHNSHLKTQRQLKVI